MAGKGIIYSNPSGDPALQRVIDALKKDPTKYDKSGMGDHYNWKGKQVKRKKKQQGPPSVNT